MKRFLLFLVVAISAVSLGLTIYYFSADNEVIYIKTSYIVCEVGDTISTDDLLTFEHKDENTKITYGVDNGNNVLSFKTGDEYYVADKGGSASIIITTTNRSYPRLVINVLVCDGSKEFPFIVNSVEELNLIGKNDKYPASGVYKLNSDIVLSENENGNWTPINNFTGILDGNFHTISNVHITNATLAAGSITGNAGFVGMLDQQAVIKNLYLNNIKVEVSGVDNIGSIAGTNKGLVQAVQIQGSVISNGDVVYLGGVSGINQNGKIDRSGFSGDIIFNNSMSSQYGGGIAGLNKCGVISESYFRAVNGGLIKNSSAKFGGIVGMNQGESDKKANLYDNYFYMSTMNDEFNKDNVGGVIYDGVNGNSNNFVLGNYFGGDLSESAIKIHHNSFLEINTRTNGYLTKLSFVNKESFVNAIFVNESKRFWNFDSVWEMGSIYPVLNPAFTSGSIYPKDTDNIVGNDVILTPDELYTTLSNSSENASYTIVGTKVGNEQVIDFSTVDWVWGDENHPIPVEYNGILTCENNCVIKNLKIQNLDETITASVGLISKLGYKANIKNLTFDNVTIIGNKAKNAGVLAGENCGALIENIKLKNITFEIAAEYLGGIVGVNTYSKNGEDLQNSINGFTINNLKAKTSLSNNAGGVVALNEGIITNSGSEHSFVKNVDLLAINAGGAVAINQKAASADASAKSGMLSYVTVQDFCFNSLDNETLSEVEDVAFIIGGVVANNAKDAIILEVVSRIDIKVKTIDKKSFVLGGIVGWNHGQVSNSKALKPFLYSKNIYSVFAGGIAGMNGENYSNSTLGSAKIINCSVDEGEIDTSTVNMADQTMIDFKAGSIVGGIAGYNGPNIIDMYSIENCFVNINKMTGRAVGGIVARNYGKITKSGVGSYGRLGGNIALTGCLVGGITVFNYSNATVNNCYTFTTLMSAFDGTYVNDQSIRDIDVCSRAGMTLVHAYGAVMESCFAVCDFGGANNSVTANTILKNLWGWDDGNTIGTTKYLLFQTLSTSPLDVQVEEKQLTEEEFRSSTFFSHIAENITKAKEVWKMVGENYPVLKDLKIAG